MKDFFSWSLSTFKHGWELLAKISKCPYLHKSQIFSELHCSTLCILPATHASPSQQRGHYCTSQWILESVDQRMSGKCLLPC
jgi:hypothetical protein